MKCFYWTAVAAFVVLLPIFLARIVNVDHEPGKLGMQGKQACSATSLQSSKRPMTYRHLLPRQSIWDCSSKKRLWLFSG